MSSVAATHRARGQVVRILLAISVLTGISADAAAYGVLAHEATIDASWDDTISPLLAARFPLATDDELKQARAYAYGGAIIQDLGYYPFGSHFFSNLMHYVRSGDFVAAVIDEAQNLNEYAFGLGALAHYAADNTGHPVAVNRAVALMYPKLRMKYGDRVTYVESPSTHVLVEFSFDVAQSAAGAYVPQAYHDFIGFEVATPVLERAFRRTYGLEVKAVLPNEDLALSSYRHAVSVLIPEITRVAWHNSPGVFELTRDEYERMYGTNYQKPGVLTRFLGFLYKLLPKVGPLRPLKFEQPTPEADALFLESLRETRVRYRDALAGIHTGGLILDNMNFDTGKPAARGDYSLADDTYAELLKRLEARHFATVSDDLRRHIVAYYDPSAEWSWSDKTERKRNDQIRRQLTSLNASARVSN